MSDENKKDEPRAQADNDGIAVGSLNVDGSVHGTIIIGDKNVVTTGYTAEQVAVIIAQIRSTFQPKPFDGRCPYKGLDVFEEEDAELFFGREKLVDDLVSRVKDSRTVFVTGPSGSGKSSLVRAGLIHALKQGAIKNSGRWLYATMKPGRDPIGELGRVISSLASSTNPEDEIRAKAITDTTIFTRWSEIALKEGRDKRLILFIDQFEEVFTQLSKEEERVAFLNLLTHAATIENGRVIILFSMRSDFVSNCATYPQLNALLNQQFLQIGAMQPEELVSAIAQPALRVGLRIDPDLIAQIINEMKGEPGALPLMQFALKDLFDSQQEKSGVIALTLNDYLQRGGIHKALERHADDSFSKLSKNEQELARSIFSILVKPGKDAPDTRRTVLFNDIVPDNTKSEDIETIVQKLADARLLTTDEQAGKDTVTISHEKLIDAWPWLNKLVNENRDIIALKTEISEDAKEWEDNKRDVSYLYSGARLANISEQLKSNKLNLSGTAFDYIRAGQGRHQRTRVFLYSGVSILLILSIIASLVFRNQAEESRILANIALARQLASQAQSINFTSSSKQMIASLLDIQSLKVIPNSDAANFLINNNLSAHPTSSMIYDSFVRSVAFSPDGKYVVSGSGDGTTRVWEAATGMEVARMPHDASVIAVAFSPDGKYVVSGSADKTARVWEGSTGKEIARMTHDDLVASVAFRPDGKYVVSGSGDGTARVWEAGTGKEVSRMTHDGSVDFVAFSPDGNYVVSGSADNTVRVWEVSTGKEISRMAHNDHVTSIAFSPDGKYVISGSADQTARVWEAGTGMEIARMTHDDFVESVAFSPDGKYVVSGSWDDTARVWEAGTGKEIARMTHDDIVRSVAFSPDGKYVVSGSGDGTARVWETATGVEVARMNHDVNRMTHNDYGMSVAFSSDGKYVVSGSCDQTVLIDLERISCIKGSARVWKVAIGVEVDLGFGVNSIAFSSDGKYVVSGNYDNTAHVWEAATGEEVSLMNHEYAVNSVAFSPDDNYVVSGGDRTARVWEANTGKEIAHMTHNREVTSVAFSPDGKYVVSGSKDNTARVWDAGTSKEIARMTHDSGVYSVSFSPDGKYVVSGSSDGTARVWEVSTGKEVARMAHNDDVTSVVFSPDGNFVVSGSWDKTARVWEASSGKEIARMTHEDAVNSVAFSPDGNFVVSGSWDKTDRVWKASTGKEVARMNKINGIFDTSVVFSPDGKYVVSGSVDGTARVWEVSTGKEVARMAHNDDVTSVVFSPDGNFVVSGSMDGIARVWEWQLEDLIANACASMPRNLTRAEWDQYIGDALPYQAVCENLPIEPEVTPTPISTSTP